MADEEYIPVEEVARLLGMSRRQAHRYSNRIRTQIQNGRKLFHRADVEMLAAERKAVSVPPPRLQPADLVPVGEMLRYLQETQDNLNRAMLEIGRLQGTVEHQQKLLADAGVIQRRLGELEAERNELRQEVDRLGAELQQVKDVRAERDELQEELHQLRTQPWWRRILWRRSS